MNDFYSFRKVVIQEELLFSEMDYFRFGDNVTSFMSQKYI